MPTEVVALCVLCETPLPAGSSPKRKHCADCRSTGRKRLYREANRDYAPRRVNLDRVRHANRRAKEFGRIGRLTVEDIVAVLDSQDGVCFCGSPAVHMDHIRGLAEGGLNLSTNLQFLCDRCHGRKSALEGHARVAA